MIESGRRTAGRIGNALLWVLAAVGVVSVVVWSLTAFGLIRPLIVISGSMEPAIMTGDLLIDTPNDPADLRVGEVASIVSAVNGRTVTHRVVAVHRTGQNMWEVTMKGDGNDVADSEPYVVTDEVWQPALRLPGFGYAVRAVTRPSVAVPLAVALVALLALSLQSSDRPVRASRSSERVGPDLTAPDPIALDRGAADPIAADAVTADPVAADPIAADSMPADPDEGR